MKSFRAASGVTGSQIAYIVTPRDEVAFPPHRGAGLRHRTCQENLHSVVLAKLKTRYNRVKNLHADPNQNVYLYK